MVNSQNNNWLAQSSQNEPILMETQNPVHFTVFGEVTNMGDDDLPFIISHSFRIKMEANIKRLYWGLCCTERERLSFRNRLKDGIKDNDNSF